jgi:hypothetical protein
MNKFFKTLSFLAAVAFLVTACIPPVVEVARAAPAEVSYRAVLGKSLSDQAVADFIASNDCKRSGSFTLCQQAGVAFWANEDQILKTAYLYVSPSNGFSAYTGDLPMSLEASDTMSDVEIKMGQFRVPHAPQAGWDPGLPDEGSTPDHAHYWAIYKRFAFTVIYSSPDPGDKNASIHAILTRQ